MRISVDVGGRDKSATDDFPLNLHVAAIGIPADRKIDRLAFVERQQQFLRDRIISVTLLENLQRAPGEVAQDDGVGLEVGGDASEVDVVGAALQVKREVVASDEKVLVVDRE